MNLKGKKNGSFYNINYHDTFCKIRTEFLR